MAAMPDVQRSGRVRGYEFHLQRHAGADVGASVSALKREHAADFLVVGVFFEKEIDESRAGDLHLGDGGARRQQAQQCVG
jgi:hypothetical protein